MKTWISLVVAMSILVAALPVTVGAGGGYATQFLGVCQKCGCDIIACYRPVQCVDGGIQWQWVTQRHDHCRPAYKGRKKPDLFRSPLVNPANKKHIDLNHPDLNCCR